jgi:hypothetical protein
MVGQCNGLSAHFRLGYSLHCLTYSAHIRRSKYSSLVKLLISTVDEITLVEISVGITSYYR